MPTLASSIPHIIPVVAAIHFDCPVFHQASFSAFMLKGNLECETLFLVYFAPSISALLMVEQKKIPLQFGLITSVFIEL